MARTDMFLKATGQRTGEIVGESIDKIFGNQIDVVDWGWSMSAPTAVGGARTARLQLGEVKLVKRVDKASTALMNVMKGNELLTTAVLSVRKSGGASPLPYVIVTLKLARLTSFEVQSDVAENGSPTLTEHWGLTFKSVDFEYTSQGATGAAQGGSMFSADAAPE